MGFRVVVAGLLVVLDVVLRVVVVVVLRVVVVVGRGVVVVVVFILVVGRKVVVRTVVVGKVVVRSVVVVRGVVRLVILVVGRLVTRLFHQFHVGFVYIDCGVVVVTEGGVVRRGALVLHRIVGRGLRVVVFRLVGLVGRFVRLVGSRGTFVVVGLVPGVVGFAVDVVVHLGFCGVGFGLRVLHGDIGRRFRVVLRGLRVVSRHQGTGVVGGRRVVVGLGRGVDGLGAVVVFLGEGRRVVVGLLVVFGRQVGRRVTGRVVHGKNIGGSEVFLWVNRLVGRVVTGLVVVLVTGPRVNFFLGGLRV